MYVVAKSSQFMGFFFSYRIALLSTGLPRNHSTAIVDPNWDYLHSMEQRQSTVGVCIRHKAVCWVSVRETVSVLSGGHADWPEHFTGGLCVQEAQECWWGEIKESLLVEGVASITSWKHTSRQRKSLRQVFLGTPYLLRSISIISVLNPVVENDLETIPEQAVIWHEFLLTVTEETMCQAFGNKRSCATHQRRHLRERWDDLCCVIRKASQLEFDFLFLSHRYSFHGACYARVQASPLLTAASRLLQLRSGTKNHARISGV
jgi:hypothetical protein